MALHYVTVRQGDKYGYEYTEKLKHQVPGLICLGDDRPLQSDLQGWHAKLELFAPWNRDLRPLLFFDLDTYVVGDLSPFDKIDHSRFWMINDFNVPRRGESGLLLVPDAAISSLIWVGRENMKSTDGAYLRNFPHNRLNEVDGIVSYKNHCRNGIPAGARIICFHGQPKPANVEGWAGDYWNEL